MLPHNILGKFFCKFSKDCSFIYYAPQDKRELADNLDTAFETPVVSREATPGQGTAGRQSSKDPIAFTSSPAEF